MSVQTDVRDALWTDVCGIDAVHPGRGVAVLVDGQQVALFRVDDDVFAVANRDPFSGANVIARGIVGSRGDILKVASPMYKQCFDLRTGRCLEEPDVALATFAVRARNGRVEIASR
ncbi:MAG: nitrite reductase small subunit NirD [Actinobacteria bacterium]|nr:nitrite reductase small subunit NirD [Actinomycetota bacterium]